MVALLALLVLSQDGIRLKNQSGPAKAVRELNCVGPGISCSATSTFGTIYIDAGAGIQAATPIYIDGGVVLCQPAGVAAGGCLTGTGQQHIAGIKIADEIWSFSSGTVYVPSLLAASLDTYYGLATGGPVFPNASGLSLGLFGRRTDGVANVYVNSQTWVDGGVTFSVQFPGCGFGGGSMFDVTTDNVAFGGALDRTCSGNGDLELGALVDKNGNAGHKSMLAANQLALIFAGNLGASRAIEADGGKPVAADYNTAYNSSVVQTLSDGGTYFANASRHGDGVLTSRTTRYQGLIGEVENPGRASGGHVWGVTYWGSMVSSDQIVFANFPAANAPTLTIEAGQQYVYSYSGELAHDAVIANTENTGHWRNRHTFADAGAEWVTMVDTSQIKSGTCTLDGAAPSKCSVALPTTGASCSCSGKGTSAAIANAGCAWSVTAYTATFYSSNGLTHDVGYVCF